MSAVVGIDIGSTASKVAQITADGADIIARGPGHESVRAHTEAASDSRRRGLLSRLAMALASGSGGPAISSADWTTRSEPIFRHLLEQSTVHMGSAPGGVAIAVPAWFDDSDRASLRNCASAAGWTVLGLVNEPTAAALATGQLKNPGANVAVFGLTRERFDITLLTVRDGRFEVLAANGILPLNNPDPEDILPRTARPCIQALRDAALSPADIDAVVLVGAIAGEPEVAAHIEAAFGQSPTSLYDAEHVVAIGAAVQAIVLDHDRQG